MKRVLIVQFSILGVLWGLCMIVTLIMAMAGVNSVYMFYLVLFGGNRAAIFGVGIVLIIIPFLIGLFLLIRAVFEFGFDVSELVEYVEDEVFGKIMVAVLCVISLICVWVGSAKWDSAKAEESNMYIGESYVLKLSETDGGYSIDKFCGKVENLVLPGTYNGKSIVEIGFSSFGQQFNENNVQRITLPRTITKIDNGAFLYCSKLTMIIIPQSVITMGYDIFGSNNMSYDGNINKIYCEASSKPDGWDKNWCGKLSEKVVWGYKG